MRSFVLVLIAAYFSTAVLAAQTAITLRETALLAEASQASAQVTTLAKDSEVVLLQRKGGWYQVQASEQHVGWLRMLSVRFSSEPSATKGDSNVLTHLVSGAAQIVPVGSVATGVRGATDEPLADGDHDPERELEKVSSFVPTASEVKSFAAEGELNEQEISEPAAE